MSTPKPVPMSLPLRARVRHSGVLQVGLREKSPFTSAMHSADNKDEQLPS